MKTPHKHAELIKAWADGAEIEFYDRRFNEHRWKLCGEHPVWIDDVEYRLKAKPDVVMCRQIKVTRFPDAGSSTGFIACTTELPANVEMVFDGETGELKEIELL